MRTKNLLLIFLLLFSGLNLRVFSQAPGGTWVVPETIKGKVSPFKFTPDIVKQGETLYQRNCKACHGDPGQNNFAKLVPEPGDPAGAKFQKQKDGEIFFKITEGKTPMPSFKSILTEPDRWSVVAYVRSFNKSYVQPVPGQGGAVATKEVKLEMSYDSTKRRVTVLCSEVTKENQLKPLESAGIQLLLVRYFGNMTLSEPKLTDNSGRVRFAVPAGIPGDAAGMITLIAKVNDGSGLLGDAETTLKATAGVPIHPVALNAQRAMWNTRDKAPIWLTLVFSVSLVSVWGIIFYILFAIGRIRKA